MHTIELAKPIGKIKINKYETYIRNDIELRYQSNSIQCSIYGTVIY